MLVSVAPPLSPLLACHTTNPAAPTTSTASSPTTGEIRRGRRGGRGGYRDVRAGLRLSETRLSLPTYDASPRVPHDEPRRTYHQHRQQRHDRGYPPGTPGRACSERGRTISGLTRESGLGLG